MMNVVVVESPTKASTIGRYLGPDYTVVASYGHVRDLLPKDGSVRPDDAFAMDWTIADGAEKRINAIGPGGAGCREPVPRDRSRPRGARRSPGT